MKNLIILSIITVVVITGCKANYNMISEETNVLNASLKEEMKKAVLYDFYDGDSSKIDFTKYPFN